MTRIPLRMEKRESGLVVPATPPAPKPPPKRKRGPLELQDHDSRELAKEAFSKLWDAMDLSVPCGGLRMKGNPSPEAYEAYCQAYQFVGKMLLGDDCPEKEVLT